MHAPVPPVVKDLIDAKALIQDPRDWTKDAFIRKSLHGGIRRCIRQAINHVTKEEPNRLASALYVLNLQLPAGCKNLEQFNDSSFTSHARVMDLLDSGIQWAMAEANWPAKGKTYADPL